MGCARYRGLLCSAVACLSVAVPGGARAQSMAPAVPAPPAAEGRRSRPVDLPGDIGRAIASCWHAPHEGDQITLKLSFRRDGSVFGRPRITFGRAASGGPDGGAELATSIYAALSACTPLPFTARLGAAIAGRVLLLRFVAPRRGLRVQAVAPHSPCPPCEAAA